MKNHKTGSITHGVRSYTSRYLRGELDWRTSEAQLLKREREALIADKGGIANLSNAELLLIEQASFKATLCAMIEAYTLGQDSPFTKDGALLPVLAGNYLGFANSLRRDLVELGLRRGEADFEDALTYARRVDAERAADAQNADESDGGNEQA